MSQLSVAKSSGNFSKTNMAKAVEKYNKAMLSDEKEKKFILDYLPLVKSVVLRMKHNFPDYCQLEDLYGIGARALVLAVNQFDSSKGKSFGNYAALRIRGSLLDELRRIDCLPRANRAKAKSLQQTILKLEAKNKRSPSAKEIKEELNITDQEYSVLLKDTQPVSFVPIENQLDGSSPNTEGNSLLETLEDPTEENSSERLESKEKVEILRDLIKSLPDQQKQILMLYYYEELRLSEIAEVFNLSEGRISQILSQCILTLKAQFKSVS